MLAILGAIRPLSIVLAPSVGGILGASIGWRNVFYILSGWGVINILATKFLLVESLYKKKEINIDHADHFLSSGLESVKTICADRNSVTLILIMSFLFSTPTIMLSNIAFLLEGYGLSEVSTSLMIGSLPLMMILASVFVVICARNPHSVLKGGNMALFSSAVVGMCVASFLSLRKRYIFFMSPLYIMVFSQSIFGPPAMALYLEPWGDKSGFASGLMTFSRTLMSTSTAAIATAITAKSNVHGFLYFISFITLLGNGLFWTMPLTSFDDSGEYSVLKHNDNDDDVDDCEDGSEGWRHSPLISPKVGQRSKTFAPEFILSENTTDSD